MTQRQPLYLRLYFQPHLTDLVRLIGYDGVPVKDTQAKFELLIEKYGETKMREASQEIVEIDNSRRKPIARLTEPARKLAVGILGRPSDSARTPVPPAVETSSAPSPEAKPQETPKTTTAPAKPPRPRAVRMPRSTVIRHYVDWLEESCEQFVSVEEARQSACADVKLSTLDFVVYGKPKILLVTVRRSLRKKEREDMQHWREIFGADYKAVRVWPQEGAEGWTWKQYPIEP